MTGPDIEMAYPLCWVDGRSRTSSADRKPALWRSGGRSLTVSDGHRRLTKQLRALTSGGCTWRTANAVLSTNIRFTASGARDQNISRRDPEDPGVAFYFDLDGKPHALACDRWETVQDNIAAIAAHIEALRSQERWGVADLAQAFAGHVALPAPEQWWGVLGVSRSASPAEIDAAWRSAMRSAHPDQGGSDAAAARLNWARDEAKRGREQL